MSDHINFALGLIPQNKDIAHIRERAAEILAKQINPYPALLVSYPLNDSLIYNTTKSGIVNVHFPSGRITDPLNGENRLQTLIDKCRSLFIHVDDADSKIFLDDKELIHDHCLSHILSDIEIEKLTIKFPTGRIPDRFRFFFVACNKPFMAYRCELFLSHSYRFSDITDTTDNYQTTLLRHVAAFDSNIIVTKNTGANALTLNVEQSPNGNIWFPVSGYPKNVNAGNTDELIIQAKYHFLKTQVKSVVAGFSTTFSQSIQSAR